MVGTAVTQATWAFNGESDDLEVEYEPSVNEYESWDGIGMDENDYESLDYDYEYEEDSNEYEYEEDSNEYEYEEDSNDVGSEKDGEYEYEKDYQDKEEYEYENDYQDKEYEYEKNIEVNGEDRV